MNKSSILIVVLFLAAALLRFADVFRPINLASWRECDLGAISRNFATESMNPLYPRIDWRGDGDGYAEMELPLVPWLTAVTYKIFGIHDYFGRVWAFLFSLGAMFFFYRLAREYLSIFAATVAFAFFALNPLMVETATSIQPEGLMIFTYIAAAYYFVKWLKTESDLSFWAATVFTALTLLAKAPAAHIGLFFGILLIDKFGWNAFRQGKVWLFGILSVLPSALWYFHAKNLWIVYGNSLGVSNEYHWVGLDFFTDATFVTGILRSEFVDVWVSFGLIAGAFAIWRGFRENAAKHSLAWLASVFVFYLLAARTTSQEWANYYHVFSIPPVALIFGFGVQKLWDYVKEYADYFSKRSLAANLARPIIVLVVIAAIFASLVVETKHIRSNFLEHYIPEPAFVWAERVKPLLKNEGLIVASGGHCVDPHGYMLAYNASYMFYWLERKGWNVCVEDQSINKIHILSEQGAKYFVAQRSMLNKKPGFTDELRREYPIVDETDKFISFDLNTGH